MLLKVLSELAIDRVYREEKWKSQVIISQACPYTYPIEAASLKSHYLSTSSLRCSAQKCLLKIVKLQTACFYVLAPSSLLLEFKGTTQKNIALTAILENTSQVSDIYI